MLIEVRRRRVSGLFSAKSLLCLYVFFSLILLNLTANAAEDACKTLMTKAMQPEAKVELVDPYIQALSEERTLNEVVTGDLTAKSPWIVMNSAQRLKQMNKTAGVSEMINPKTGAGHINRYDLLSGGHSWAKGLRVIGHEESLDKAMGVVDGDARGDTAGRYPIILVGPPGTGKTAKLKIFGNAFEHVTLHEQAMFRYTYEWKDLSRIPKLAKEFEAVNWDTSEYKCPLDDSPFVILDPQTQKNLVAKMSAQVRGLVGSDPRPKTEMCSHCRYIREQILLHYAKEQMKAGKGSLTPEQITKILNDFVVVKRKIMDESSVALLPAQSKDVKYNELFGDINPIVAQVLGRQHPLATFLTGVIPRTNGGVIIFDEALKNPAPLLSKYLTLLQDHVVSEGAIKEHLDFVGMMATNTKELAELRETDPQSPFLSRATQIPFLWSIRPNEIATILALEIPELRMRDLSEPKAPEQMVGENVTKLYPPARFGEVVQGAEGRYDLHVGEGADAVHVAPYAIPLMTATMSLTRQDFKLDPAQHAALKMNKEIISQPFFTDPFTRLKGLMGLSQVTEAQATELWRLSDALGQGSRGFDHRDGSKWFTAAINLAKRSENGHCISPLLVQKALEVAMLDPDFKTAAKERGETLRYADELLYKYVYPQMRRNIMDAISLSRDDSAFEIYDSVIASFVARGTDPFASHYIDKRSGKRMEIKEDLLKEIGAIYKKNEGRDLSPTEVAGWYLQFAVSEQNQQAQAAPQRRIFSPLWSAITEYHAKNMAKAHETDASRWVRIALGQMRASTSEEEAQAQGFIRHLKERMGYCNHCVAEALQAFSSNPAEASEGKPQQ